MIGTLFVSIIPFIPGPVLMWALAVIYAVVTSTLPPASLVIITLLMLAGATSDYWLPFAGVRTQGLTCLGAVGSIIGGLVGTFLIPLPILGTLIGSIAGAVLVEFVRFRQTRQAITAGQIAFKLYLWSTVIQFILSLAILLTFVATLLLLQPPH
ncbi:MAG: hypothetical protein CL610_18605 [Anaerolineaceae bacterium]|nr:hypothetical protein [Anaerolineaceae bacterium]